MLRNSSVATVLTLSIIAGIALMSGCSKPVDYTGSWQGDRQLETAKTAPEHIRGTINRVKLTLDRNGRFEYTEFGLVYKGRVEETADEFRLHRETFLDQKLEASDPRALEPVVVSKDKKGEQLSIAEDPNMSGSAVHLIRVVSKPE
jgi:hypothetical protein